MSREGVPGLLVMVGTDVHPFDRLIDWVDNWLQSRENAVDCLVQYGSSRSPKVARGRNFLPGAELKQAVAGATVVVCHGGPATIAEVRASGRLPLVVPRSPDLGEHVDDHQQRFGRHVASCGWGLVVEDEAEFGRLMNKAFDDPAFLQIGTLAGSNPPGADRFRSLVTNVVRPPKILLIAGFGRSGSTLLSGLAGRVDGWCEVGELVFLWERGLVANELCSCGSPFAECPFWTEVGRRAFGGWDQVDSDRALTLRRQVDRNRRLLRLGFPRLSRKFARRLNEWAGEYLAPLYRAIAEVAGAEVIVDSSKNASYAYLLRRVPGFETRVVNLVRDPRGVAYSWTKQVARPESVAGTTMPRYGPAASTCWWIYHNTVVRLLPMFGVRTRVFRYEDLVADPGGTLKEVARFAGHSPEPDLNFLGQRSVAPGIRHSVAGNPMRFGKGEVVIKHDDQWKRSLPGRDLAVVNAIAALAPWLSVRYLRGRATYSGAVPAPLRFPVVRRRVPDLPAVSVVISTRDRPLLLRRAIEGVLCQQYPGPLEVIVVFDQCAVDGTVARVNDSRPVRVIKNSRSAGLAGGRNSGIAAATGDLIAFCDDDDVWLPGKLAAQVELLLQNPAAAAATSGILVDFNGVCSERKPDRAAVSLPDLLRSRVSWVHPSTLVIRRGALDEIGWVDEDVPGGYGEDYEFLLRVAKHHPILAAPECYTTVYWHQSSYYEAKWETIVAGLTWLIERYPEFDVVPKGKARIAGQIAFANASLGHRREAVRWMACAMRRNPLEPRTILAAGVATRVLSSGRTVQALHRRGRGI